MKTCVASAKLTAFDLEKPPGLKALLCDPARILLISKHAHYMYTHIIRNRLTHYIVCAEGLHFSAFHFPAGLQVKKWNLVCKTLVINLIFETRKISLLTVPDTTMAYLRTNYYQLFLEWLKWRFLRSSHYACFSVKPRDRLTCQGRRTLMAFTRATREATDTLSGVYRWSVAQARDDYVVVSDITVSWNVITEQDGFQETAL